MPESKDNKKEKEYQVRWEACRSAAPRPNCRAGSSSANSPEEVFARRLEISGTAFVAFMQGRGLRQNADLASLPSCRNLVGRNGVGDFVGRGRHGLKLQKYATTVDGKRDYRIPAGPWQAWKVWDWLRTSAPTHLESVANQAGFATAAEAEEEVLLHVEAAQAKEEELKVGPAGDQALDGQGLPEARPWLSR